MTPLSTLVKDAADFVNSEFNLALEKSKVKAYSHENWKRFCDLNNLNANAEGAYIPEAYSAYVNRDNPSVISNLFHELFGHGLFCEHSQLGKDLIKILNEQKDAKPFLYSPIDPRVQALGLCKQNIGNYEGFALWLEALLCKQTGNQTIWESKESTLPHEDLSILRYFQDAEQTLTRFGFMSQLGFPKNHTLENIVNLLRHIYDEQFNNISIAMLYGSQKPYSDIDLFIVSQNRSKNYFNGWLDIYELNVEEFKERIKNLDISITDPLFTGKLITGDDCYVEKLKQSILKMTITPKAIKFNLSKAKELEECLPYFNGSLRDERTCLSYIESYSKNAEALMSGRKLLTLKALKV